MRRGWACSLLAGSLLAAAPGAAAAPIAPLSDGAEIALPPLDPAVPSPEEVLGYRLGARFTHHERIVDYLERLAGASARVAMWEYGRSYEDRPLTLLAISSPRNLERLEAIRTDHLRRLDPDAGAPAADGPVVVWLAYGVHGNESSSAEAAMATAYVLAAAEGEWAARLDEVVVLLDPLTNPDGRERYVHFYETHRGRRPDPLPVSAEHDEPWPGGRQNHYLFDLNRDWAWATQRETRARLAAYRRWEPQVYVDFHEMSADSSYFFPPPAEPVNPRIESHTAGWLSAFGRGNAAAFDRYGWVYYAAENFDLFYPGYGDSYPSLRGAVGMTYEMAGHGRAGQSLERADGTLLTLADRVARHFTTSLATVSTAIDGRAGLLADHAAALRAAAAAPPRTYLWAAAEQEARTAAELLARHGIAVARLSGAQTLQVRALGGGGERTRRFAAGAYAVSTAQPLGNLLRALLELDTTMPDRFVERQRRRIEANQRPEFYDITAWSLPLALNLETWILDGPPPPGRAAGDEGGGIEGEGEFGFLVAPQGLAGYRLAAALSGAGLRFRVAVRPFSNAGTDYPSGTLFVPRRGNPDDLEPRLGGWARELGLTVRRTPTGYSPDGVSLGSDSVVAVRPPRIGLVRGAGVSPTSLGALWHLLDRDLELDHHLLGLDRLGALDLDRFDVLLLPGGFGYGRLDDEVATALEQWVSNGGILVAVGGAVSWLRERKLVDVKSWQPKEEKGDDPNAVVELTPANRRLYTPGAALATRLREGHPLAAGLAAPPAELFIGREILLATGDPRQDVLTAADDPVLAGFAWPEAAERLRGALLVGVQGRGRGAVVVFAQEPAFRLFWRAKLPLFLNAVLYGPSLAEAGWL